MNRVLTYSLEFRGDAVDNGPGLGLLLRASAPPCTHETRVETNGLASRFFFGDCENEAILESRLALHEDGRFAAITTVDFGHGHRLWGQTEDDGRLLPSADVHLRQGTATIHVIGGAGQFRGASGQITSNFVLSDTGDLTDNQLGMLFLRELELAAL